MSKRRYEQVSNRSTKDLLTLLLMNYKGYYKIVNPVGLCTLVEILGITKTISNKEEKRLSKYLKKYLPSTEIFTYCWPLTDRKSRIKWLKKEIRYTSWYFIWIFLFR